MKRLKDKLRQQAETLAQRGQVYAMTPAFIHYGIWLSLTIFFIWAFFSIPAEGRDQWGLTVALLGVIMFSIPLCWWDLRLNVGFVVLTETGINVVRLRHTQTMDYAGIIEVEESNWWIPPHIVLRSTTQTLRINRHLKDLSHLYQTLLSRSAGFARAIQPHPSDVLNNTATLDIRVKPLKFWISLLGFAGICLAGFAFIIFYNIQTLQPDATLYDYILENGALLFFMLVILILYDYRNFKYQQPFALVATAHQIRYWRFRRGWVRYPTNQITQIQFLQSKNVVFHMGIEVRTPASPLQITFADGTTFQIDDRRAQQCGTNIQRIYWQLRAILPAMPDKGTQPINQ